MSFLKRNLIDLDGTLADSRLNIQWKQKYSLRTSKTHPCFIVYRKTICCTLFINYASISSNKSTYCSGGGQLVQSDGTILWESKIPSSQIKEMQNMLIIGSGFVFGQGQTLYCNSKVTDKFQTHPWNFRVGLPNTLSD